MPITVEADLRILTQDEFHAIDRRVMKIAFAIHREFGRLCDEQIYQTELAHRCRKSGLESVATEVAIHVSSGTFTKIYYIDLLVEHGVIYELKTAAMIVSEHRKQALHYLLAAGLNHGKLINFRPASVEHEFVSTRLTPQQRRRVSLDLKRWHELDADSEWLAAQIRLLVADWGMFLDVDLFYEALTHFRGGEANALRRIPVEKDGRLLGTQRTHILNPTTAFTLSAATRDTAALERHLRNFLALTRLTAIQWVNFNHQILEFVSLTK